MAELEKLVQNEMEENDEIIQTKTANICNLQEQLVADESSALEVKLQLEATIHAKEEEVDHLKEDLKRVSADATDMQAELNSVTLAKDVATLEVAALEGLLKSKTKETDDIIQVKVCEIGDLQEQLVADESSALEARLQLEAVSHAKEEEVDRLKMDLKKVSADAIDLHTELNSVYIGKDAATSEVAAPKELLKNQMKEKDDIIQIKVAKISDLQEQPVADEASALEARLQLETIIQTSHIESEKASAEMRSLQDQIQNASDSIAEETEEVATLTANVKYLGNDLQETQEFSNKKLMEEQNNVSQSKALASNLGSKLELSGALLSKANIDMQGLFQDQEQLEKQVNDLNMLLAKNEETISEQKDANKSFAIELVSMSASIDELRSGNESKVLDLKSKEAEIHRLGNQVHELTHQAETQSASQE